MLRQQQRRTGNTQLYRRRNVTQSLPRTVQIFYRSNEFVIVWLLNSFTTHNLLIATKHLIPEYSILPFTSNNYCMFRRWRCPVPLPFIIFCVNPIRRRRKTRKLFEATTSPASCVTNNSLWLCKCFCLCTYTRRRKMMNLSEIQKADYNASNTILHWGIYVNQYFYTRIHDSSVIFRRFFVERATFE